MTPAPKHRWLRFSLRTLFVVTAAVCLMLGYQWRWIGQRQRALQSGEVEFVDFDFPDTTPKHDLAPWPLGLFGELGYPSLYFNVTRSDFELTKSESMQLERMQRLFPEAVIDLSWTDPQSVSKPVKTKKDFGGSAFDGFQL